LLARAKPEGCACGEDQEEGCDAEVEPQAADEAGLCGDNGAEHGDTERAAHLAGGVEYTARCSYTQAKAEFIRASLASDGELGKSGYGGVSST
jgi:hypothetical protein